MQIIRTHKELDVYKLSFEAAMEIFIISKKISERRNILND